MIMVRTHSQAELNGAIALLVKSLGLRGGETLAVFFDETSEQVSQLISFAASQLGILTLLRQVSREAQSRFLKGDELPLEDSSALSEALAVITCLGDHTDGLAYRRALISFGTSTDKRMAHMPGALPEFFRDAIDVDYEPLIRKCDELAIVLAVGSEAVVRTYIHDEGGLPVEEHVLRFQLGGMKRLPVISTGLISPGTWGNVPGAETFIAPIEGTAHGTYVVNGSFTDCVISGRSRILLTFSQGNLSKFDGTPDVLPKFVELMESLPRMPEGTVLGLAEFGIGTNPAVQKLVGKSLIDEKCLGTAHIAIGGNISYGGKLNAPAHEDFVTRFPSIEIDGKMILYHGKDKFVGREWRESVTEVEVAPAALRRNTQVRRTFTSAEVGDESLKVRRIFRAERLCSYTVGEPSTSKLLSRVYRQIPNLPGLLEVGDLIRSTGMAPDLLGATLTILHRHELVELKE